MKKTKILALMLSCAMLLTLFVGCGEATYGTIDGRDLEKSHFDMVASGIMSSYLQSGWDEQQLRDMLAEEDAEGVTGEEEIKEYCLNTVKQFYAVEKLAKEHNISLTDEEKKAIDEDKKADIESKGGRAAFVEMLKQNGMTEEDYDYMRYISALQQKLFIATYSQGGVHEIDETTIINNVLNTNVRVAHILIQAQENSIDYPEKQAKANEALARVNAGEDFMSLVAIYGEDPGMENNTVGYVFDQFGYSAGSSGQMDATFTEESFNLEVGQNTGLVKTSFGFHIIKRLPLEEDYVIANLDLYYYSYAQEAFSVELATTAELMKVDLNDDYDKIDLMSYITKD